MCIRICRAAPARARAPARPLRRASILTCWAAVIAIGAPASASTAVFKLVNPGPGTVAACSTLTLEIRATFDTVMTAAKFQIAASQDGRATIVDRTVAAGLSYISTDPANPFISELPRPLGTPPVKEVLLGIEKAYTPGDPEDGLQPGTDVLIETLTMEVSGEGPLTFTITSPGAANVSYLVPTNLVKWAGAWTDPGFSADGSIDALCVFDDGTGPALYAAGGFTRIGGVSALHIAKYTGTSWSPVGDGFDSPVLTLAVLNDGSGPALFAGGSFVGSGALTVNHIAKWDGSSWAGLGSGIDGTVLALSPAPSGTGVCAGGLFRTAGGATANCVAQWDGSSWSAMGEMYSGGRVLSLAVFDDGLGPALYAGGYFALPTGDCVAKWDGSSWSGLGFSCSYGVPDSLAVFDGGTGPALYADASGAAIYKWNGASWTQSTSHGGKLATLDPDGPGPLSTGLYAGGGGGIWRLTGAGWEEFFSCDWQVRALAAFSGGSGPAVYAGGSAASQSNPLSEQLFSSVSVDVSGGSVAPTVGPSVYAGDWDSDCDVDLDDFTAFDTCYSGPQVPRAAGCELKDLDNDGDVDQSDFAIFQRCYSGPGNPGNLNCGG